MSISHLMNFYFINFYSQLPLPCDLKQASWPWQKPHSWSFLEEPCLHVTKQNQCLRAIVYSPSPSPHPHSPIRSTAQWCTCWFILPLCTFSFQWRACAGDVMIAVLFSTFMFVFTPNILLLWLTAMQWAWSPIKYVPHFIIHSIFFFFFFCFLSLDACLVVQYELSLVATDSVNEAATKVIILIADVNDRPPEFDRPTYEATIEEELSEGLPIPIIKVDCSSSFH